MDLIVAMTGASGATYGIRLLEVLRERRIVTHLIVSKVAATTIRYETKKTLAEVERLAKYSYDENNVDARIASGSFESSGMIIIPCSMKTLAGVATGFATNLILRAADVTLKERRTLILVARETPLSIIHLRNMLELARMGAIILPPMPAFYTSPKSIEDIVNHTIGKILDQLKIKHDLYGGWKPPNKN
jgi:4-hydroxy-3-polyprenylbenzoate decarboxylase